MKKTIIITGASSGLGAALAIEYSKENNKLFLFGRSKTRLSDIENICRKNGSEAISIIADVTDQESMKKHLEYVINENNIDILIACAGVSGGTLGGVETDEQVRKIFDTNLNGVLNSVLPVIPHMIEKKSGNIAIINSMAGMMGLASAPSYSASKGASRLFSDAIGAYLKPYNVHVSNVIPGYIDTPMTRANKFPMPLLMSAELAAKKIISGIKSNKLIIAFPLIMYFLLKFLNFLPNNIVSYINSRLPKK